jgi:hypothetical protein
VYNIDGKGASNYKDKLEVHRQNYVVKFKRITFIVHFLLPVNPAAAAAAAATEV